MPRYNSPGFIEPEINKNEPIEIRRKRLKFRSWHRGIKEADIILGQFSDHFLSELSEEELDLYENLLRETDADLVAWITKDRPAPDHLNHKIMKKLQSIDYIKFFK
jgi:antitoxin CptB